MVAIPIPLTGSFDADMRFEKLLNLGPGIDPDDAVNKGQVDAALAAKVAAAEKGAPGGVATLDAEGKVPASQLPAVSSAGFALVQSAPGAVNLNIVTEQVIMIPHGRAAAPSYFRVVQIDVVQEDSAVNVSALRMAVGYPAYDEASSTATDARVLMRWSTPVGVPAVGRARMFFAL